MLFGVMSTQTYIYYGRFPNDTRNMKIMVRLIQTKSRIIWIASRLRLSGSSSSRRPSAYPLHYTSGLSPALASLSSSPRRHSISPSSSPALFQHAVGTFTAQRTLLAFRAPAHAPQCKDFSRSEFIPCPGHYSSLLSPGSSHFCDWWWARQFSSPPSA